MLKKTSHFRRFWKKTFSRKKSVPLSEYGAGSSAVSRRSYSHWQKVLSVFSSVVLLAPLLIKVPESQAAPGEDEKSLVVIFVEESLFEGSPDDDAALPGKIYRYAQDVQGAMPQTKSLVLPISSDESPERIFTALEKLYLEGQQRDNVLYRLTGTVLIGDIPLPVIRTSISDFVSVFPYTDFESPAFVWDKNAEVFRENEGSYEMQAEVFHGVIRAPKNNDKTEVEWLSEYFEKNHQFHSGELPPVEKALFFADMIDEFQAQDPIKRRLYEEKETEFAEDLAFYRYNQNLLDDANAVFEMAMDENIDTSALPESFQEGYDEMTTAMSDFPMPDSLTRERIEQVLPTFMQVVGGYTSDAGPLIRGSGRWMVEEDTADTIPEFITRMDTISREFMREFTLFQEENITAFVEDNWQHPVTIVEGANVMDYSDVTEYYHNYFHGLQGAEVEKALQCSLYRGEPVSDPRQYGENAQFVEMNHLWNPFAEEDNDVYESKCSIYGGCCIMHSSEPEKCNPNNATSDVFDYQGGKAIETSNDILLPEPSYLDCTKINLVGSGFLGLPGTGSASVNPTEAAKKTISSVVVRNEPKPETLEAAFADMISGAIPADENRKISFQGQARDYVEIDFPNLFRLELSEDQEWTDEEILDEIIDFFAEKETDIRTKIIQENFRTYFAYAQAYAGISGNLEWSGSQLVPRNQDEVNASYEAFLEEVLLNLKQEFPDISDEDALWEQYLEREDYSNIYENITNKAGGPMSYEEFLRDGGGTVMWDPDPNNPDGTTMMVPLHFSAVEDPEAGFLIGKDGSDIEQFGGDALVEYVRWRHLTPDEKHKYVIERFFSEDTREFFGGREAGYELGSFRAHGTPQEIWWGGDEMTYLPGDDPEWDQALQDSHPEDDAQEEDIDPCTGAPYGDGVSVLEWMPAFMCWLEDTMDKPLQVETSNECSINGTIDWLDVEEEDADDILNPGPPEVPEGSSIFIESSLGGQIPIGETSTLDISFLDPEGNFITGGISYDIFPFGGIEILEDSLYPTDDASYIDATYSGYSFLPVRITDPDSAGIIVEAPGFPEQRFTFTPIAGGSLVLESVSIVDTKENEMTREFIVSAQDENGDTMTDYFGMVHLSVSDHSVASVEKSEIELSHGVGEVQVTFDAAYSTTLTATADGLSSAKLSIGVTGESYGAERLLITGMPEAIGFGERVEVEVVALDYLGNPQPLPEGVRLFATSVTEDLVTIGNSEDGKFLIRGGNRAGRVRLIAEAPGLLSDPREVPVVVKIDREDFRGAQPNAMVTSLLGSDFGNFYADGDPIANSILFSGKTHSVVSSLTSFSSDSPRVSVFEGGAVHLFEGKLETTLSELNPLRVRILEEDTGGQLIDFSLSYPKRTEIYPDFDLFDIATNEGIFFANYDTSGTLVAEKARYEDEEVFEDENSNSRLQVKYDDRTVLEVTNQGAFTLFDNRFSLKYISGGEYPELELFLDGEQSVGSFFLRGATMTLLSAPEDYLSFSPLPQNTDGSRGFLLSTGEEGNQLYGQKSLERAEKVFGPGFNMDDNFALQLASGASIGDASKYNFGPSGVLLGDPTIAVPPDDVLVSGFDRGTGQEILRDENIRIESSDLFDFDSSNFTDILLATNEDRGKVIRNFGDLLFRDHGDILDEARGFYTPSSGDLDSDGFEDILASTEQNSFQVFRNNHEVIERDPTISFPEIDAVSSQVHDFDTDGYADIVAEELSGDLSIYWGNESGFSTDEKTVLGYFGATVEPGNVAENNTLVSMPDIMSHSSSVVPLSLLESYSSDFGMYTVEELIEDEGGKVPEDIDGTVEHLEELQEFYPDVFSDDYSPTGSNDFNRTGLFAAHQDVSSLLDVSLSLEDQNGDTLRLNDNVEYQLTVKNKTSSDLHFSLAHFLNPALMVNSSSLLYPEDWDEEETHPIPVLEDLGVQGIRILNIFLEGGEEAELLFYGVMQGESAVNYQVREDLDLSPKYPADGLPDVTLLVPGLSGNIHFVSQGNREYEKYFDEDGEQMVPEIFQNMEDTDGDGVPDKYTSDDDGDNMPDYANDAFSPYQTDSDGDGIPDAWDNMRGNPDGEVDDFESAMGKLGEVHDKVLTYTQCDGGCLNIPINYAFLVPGPINIFEQVVGQFGGMLGGSGGGGPVSVDPGIATNVPGVESIANGLNSIATGVSDTISGVTGAIDETLGKIQEALGIPGGYDPIAMTTINTGPMSSCIGPACVVYSTPPTKVPYATGFGMSLWRFYISPTLTGGIGLAFCTGPATMGAVPNCVAFAPSALNISAFCDSSSENISNSSNISDVGECSIVDVRESSSHISDDDSGLRGILFDLEDFFENGSFSYSYHTGKNNRVMPFPWNWVYEQVAEFTAMFQLPSITIYYPDFSVFSTDNFQDRFGKLFDEDEPEAELSTIEISSADSDEEKEKKIKDYMKSISEASDMVVQSVEGFSEGMQTIEEIYDAFNALPLIEIQQVPIDIKVPWMSRGQILALYDDINFWVTDAEEEVERATKNWLLCGENVSVSDCEAQKALASKISVEYEQLIESGKKNLETLKSYLSLPKYVASIDALAAEWLHQIICFLDSTILYYTDWFERNKRRLILWISLFEMMKTIMDLWETIKDIFVDYERYCSGGASGCGVDRGGMVQTTFQLFMGILPTPPIIRFPRLPDIVIDFSQIKGGIIIPFPKPQIHFEPIIFPKVSPLSLPDAPSASFSLPEMPMLPELLPLPELPPFPEIPKIILPDLPPAPKLPDIPDFLADIAQAIRPLIAIYCLYKNGFILHPESQLKSVIENITSRPTKFMLDFDFAGALFEDYDIPSVREINITLETNLDFDMGDSLVESVQKAVEPWNEQATDLRYEISNAMNESLADISDDVNFNDVADSISEDVREAEQEVDSGSLSEDIRELEQDLEEGAREIEDNVREESDDLYGADDDLSYKSPKSPLIRGLNDIPEDLRDDPFIKMYIGLLEYSKEVESSVEYYDADELRRKMGLPPITLPDEHPALPELRDFREKVALLKNEYIEEGKMILATRDVTRLRGNFVANSALAAEVYETDITSALPEIESFFSDSQTSVSGMLLADVITTPEGENSQFSLQEDELKSSFEFSPAEDSSFSVSSTSASSSSNSPLAQEEFIQRDGFFGQCGGGADKIILDDDFSDGIEQMHTHDFDQDGDDDLLLVTRNGLFLKENYTQQKEKTYLTTPPEIGYFEEYVSMKEAVKNVRVDSDVYGATISFDAHFDNDLLGIELVARERRNGFFWDDKESETVLRTLLVATRYVPSYPENENSNSRLQSEFLPDQSVSFEGHTFEGDIMMQEFTQERIELPLPQGRFWHIGVREIRKSGSFSTLSEIVLAAPQQERDIFAPVVVGNTPQEGTLFEEIELIPPIVDPGGGTNDNTDSESDETENIENTPDEENTSPNDETDTKGADQDPEVSEEESSDDDLTDLQDGTGESDNGEGDNNEEGDLDEVDTNDGIAEEGGDDHSEEIVDSEETIDTDSEEDNTEELLVDAEKITDQGEEEIVGDSDGTDTEVEEDSGSESKSEGSDLPVTEDRIDEETSETDGILEQETVDDEGDTDTNAEGENEVDSGDGNSEEIFDGELDSVGGEGNEGIDINIHDREGAVDDDNILEPDLGAENEGDGTPVIDDEGDVGEEDIQKKAPQNGLLIEWDTDADGEYETEGETLLYRPGAPGEYEIPIKITDLSGNVRYDTMTVSTPSPKIYLEERPISSGLVQGYTEPKTSGIPFVVVREREGKWTKISTPSSDENGRYVTSAYGKYLINDFSFSKGAVIGDEDGKVLSKVDPNSGRMSLESEDVSFASGSSGETLLIDDASQKPFAIIRSVTDGNSDVRNFSQPLSSDQIETLPQGVFLMDQNDQDSVRVGALPGNAPSFPGGNALYSDSELLALISSRGEIKVINPDISLRMKATESSEDPMMMEILYGENPVFDFYVHPDESRIFFHNLEEEVPQILEPSSSKLSLTKNAITPLSFSDVPESHPSYFAISRLAARGMLEGYGDGTFQPERKISRAEFTKLVIAAAQCQNCASEDIMNASLSLPNSFPDVSSDAWYFFCVSIAKFFGVIEGYGDGTFQPDQNITRAEAVAVLFRAADIPLRDSTMHYVADFQEWESAWYSQYMITAIELDFVDIHFGFAFPEERITRAEFAIMADKVLQINSCTMPNPMDPGVLEDMCPEVPEDLDGIDDEDGCPEYDFDEEYLNMDPGIHIAPLSSSSLQPQFDYIADIRPNDKIFTAIIAEDDSEIFSQSEVYDVPEDLVKR